MTQVPTASLAQTLFLTSPLGAAACGAGFKGFERPFLIPEHLTSAATGVHHSHHGKNRLHGGMLVHRRSAVSTWRQPHKRHGRQFGLVRSADSERRVTDVAIHSL